MEEDCKRWRIVRQPSSCDSRQVACIAARLAPGMTAVNQQGDSDTGF
jgi:hypothetical protein